MFKDFDYQNKFAFIIHPTSISHLKTFMNWMSPLIRYIPDRKLDTFLSLMAPKKFLSIPFHFEALNQKVLFLGILCPLLPAQMVLSEKKAISKILRSVEIAKKSGANLVGLGGFTSIIGDAGHQVADRSPLPVTSGNTYTAAVILESIFKAAIMLDLELKKARVAVLGATGDIGSACVREIAKFCGSLVLVARNENRLQELLISLKKTTDAVEIDQRVERAVSRADIVITVTSAITTLIEPELFKRGAIVCDASYPPNVMPAIREKRDDLLIFEGGLVEWPELAHQVPANNRLWDFNTFNMVHGCFAETLLLSLENMNVTYSIGRGNITSDKLEKIRNISKKYKFCSAPYWHGRGGYSKRDIDHIKLARARSTATHILI